MERRGVDFSDKSDWKNQHDWLVGKLLALVAATAPMIEADELTPEDGNGFGAPEDEGQGLASLDLDEDEDEDEDDED